MIGTYDLGLEPESQTPCTPRDSPDADPLVTEFRNTPTNAAVAASKVSAGDAEALRYAVKFDRTNASVGDFIHCTFHVERLGFRGYGILVPDARI